MKRTRGKQPRSSKPNRKVTAWLLWPCVIVFLFAVGNLVDYLIFPQYAAPAAPSRNVGENGLWLNYRWYFGRYTPIEEAALVARLRMAGVRYAYVQALTADGQGDLDYHKQTSARALTDSLHKAAPDIKLYAWVYVGNASGRGKVNLNDPMTRSNLAREAVWLTHDCGFDGVQWDYEICPSGDAGFLALLDDTRTAIGPGYSVSVASALRLPGAVSGRFGWSDGYYEQVARRCDQICVMGYDSCMLTPRAYVSLMGAETACVTRDVARSNPHCGVLIGVPSYSGRTRSHNPYVENLKFALIGVRNGAAEPAARPQVLKGVAVFADYTTGYGQWVTYRELWPRRA